MHNPLSALCLILVAAAAVANAGQQMAPGFYWHEPDGISLELSNVKSGVICGDTPPEFTLCDQTLRFTVTGGQRCTDIEGNESFCTRYGYRFDYSGAEPGETMHCRVGRRNAYRSRDFEYSLTLDAESGTVRMPAWARFEDVGEQYLVSEVHECSIRGALLTTIEYIMVHEANAGPSAITAPATENPGVAGPAIDRPSIEQVPQSCKDPTEFGVSELLQADNVQAGFGNEHVPNLQSQCSYSTTGAAPRTVSFLYKFMPYAMFDVDTLSPMQLRFNATLTGGGTAPTGTIPDLGKITFVFETPARTTLLVVTGVQGPRSGGNQARELVAFYYLEDATRSHDDRLEALLSVARDRVAAWQ